MSQENSVTTRRPRPLPDRVLVRLPWLAHFFIAWLVRLRPDSALRTRLTDWSFRRGFDAINRNDPDAVGPLAYEPDAEVWVSGLELVSTKNCYRGLERLVVGRRDSARRGQANGGGPTRSDSTRTSQRGGGHGERCRKRVPPLAARKDQTSRLPDRRKRLAEGPRSRGAVGVGHVAGEPGARTTAHRPEVPLPPWSGRADLPALPAGRNTRDASGLAASTRVSSATGSHSSRRPDRLRCDQSRRLRVELPDLPPRRRDHHPCPSGRHGVRPRLPRPPSTLRLPAEMDCGMGRDAIPAHGNAGPWRTCSVRRPDRRHGAEQRRCCRYRLGGPLHAVGRTVDPRAALLRSPGGFQGRWAVGVGRHADLALGGLR